jgi:hypothetical protein
MTSYYHPADTNGDGQVDEYERAMYLEFKRKELEDADAQRDAMRKMTWFALFGMLLYPLTIMITSLFGLENAAKIIGDIAPTYFVAISALVSVFFGANAYSGAKKNNTPPAPSTTPRPSPVMSAPVSTPMATPTMAPKPMATPVKVSSSGKPGPAEEEGELL